MTQKELDEKEERLELLLEIQRKWPISRANQEEINRLAKEINELRSIK